MRASVTAAGTYDMTSERCPKRAFERKGRHYSAASLGMQSERAFTNDRHQSAPVILFRLAQS